MPILGTSSAGSWRISGLYFPNLLIPFISSHNKAVLTRDWHFLLKGMTYHLWLNAIRQALSPGKRVWCDRKVFMSSVLVLLYKPDSLIFGPHSPCTRSTSSLTRPLRLHVS